MIEAQAAAIENAVKRTHWQDCRKRFDRPSSRFEVSWLHDLPAQRIVQLHVVGYSYLGGRWHDYHREAIQEDLWALIHAVLQYARVQAIIVERDGDFPPSPELTRELRDLKSALMQHGSEHSTDTSAH